MKKTFFRAHYDVIIIGAGIIGVWTAYTLLKNKPDLHLALIDKSIVGSGASFYSLGLNYPAATNPETALLVKESLAEMDDLRKNHLPTGLFHDLPFYCVTSKETLKEQQDNFIEPLEILSEDVSAQFFKERGQISPSEILLGKGSSTQTNVFALTQHLSKSLKSNPHCHVFEGVGITDIRVEEAQVFLESSSLQQVFSCKKLIAALGPWSVKTKGKPDGLDFEKHFKLRTKKIVSLHFKKTAHPFDPMIFFLNDKAFLFPNHFSGQWNLSITSKTWDVDPEAALVLTENDLHQAVEFLEQYAPELIPHLEGGRVFCDAYSENLIPIVKPHPEFPEIIFAGAGSGIGFRLAPSIAKQVLELLV